MKLYYHPVQNGAVTFGEDVLLAQYTSLIQWFVSGNFLETDRVQPSCVFYHTFNAGTNWLCYFSQMWALLCLSPYIRRSWDLGACVTKTCRAVSVSGIEKTSECIKRFVSYYRVRQPIHKNSPGDCKHLLPDFSWGMWTALLEYLQFEFSVLQP